MTAGQLMGSTPGAAPYRPPQGAEQEALCAIFADVLRRPRIGIDDDFFALGGRSIDGVLIAAGAAEVLGRRVSLADLFDAPTVAELHEQLRGASGDHTTAERNRL